MKLLFEIDLKNYNKIGTSFIRPSVRGIILRKGKAAMVYSKKYHYYKFPGGGIEEGEDHNKALIRETAEETGLIIIPDTIREYGYVHRIQKGDTDDIFIQDNYYYFCGIEEETVHQNLDDYEKDAEFVLRWIDPAKAIEVNKNTDHGDSDEIMIERETKVLETLISLVQPE